MAEPFLLQRCKELSFRRKLVLSCAAGAAAVAAVWFVLFKPQLETIHSLEQDIQQIDQTIARYRAKVQRLPELTKDLEARKREMLYAQTLLPETNADVENLLSSIEKLGNKAGIDFLLFTPSQERRHDFYASRTVTVRFQGTFHNLMRFFNRLSGLDRLVTLESVQLRPVSKNRSQGVSLQADCRLQIYRILSEQEKKDSKNT